MPKYRLKLRDPKSGDVVSIFLHAADERAALERARALVREAARSLLQERLVPSILFRVRGQ